MRERGLEILLRPQEDIISGQFHLGQVQRQGFYQIFPLQWMLFLGSKSQQVRSLVFSIKFSLLVRHLGSQHYRIVKADRCTEITG